MNSPVECKIKYKNHLDRIDSLGDIYKKSPV